MVLDWQPRRVRDGDSPLEVTHEHAFDQRNGQADMELGEILIIVFTGVVAVSTGAYAFLTWKLVSETRRLREVQTEPRVSIRVEADHTGRPGYELVVENNGHGTARNVTFEFDGDPSYFRSSWVNRRPPVIDELPVIKNGLDFLEPNQVYRFPLGTVSSEEYERAAATPWTFRTQYESLFGKRRTDTYVVDFSQFRGMLFEPNHLKEITDHMKAVRQDIHRLTEGHARVQTVTQTREEYERQREEWQKAQESQGHNASEIPITDNDEE